MRDVFTSTLAVASVSLHDLFDANELLDSAGYANGGTLHLPEYQRPYRWSSDQVQMLFDDLQAHFSKPELKHDFYLGSIILHRGADQRLNIIDGQQRLTSIAILCELSGVRPAPALTISAPESQHRIRANFAALRDSVRKGAARFDLHHINVTLVITNSEDDAYRFFETQNSGGVRLSGIDIAKAHHLRPLDLEDQNRFAIAWERMGRLSHVVDCVMRGRLWQTLNWRDLASKGKQPNSFRDQVVHELAASTDDRGLDTAYQLQITNDVAGKRASQNQDWLYDMRQPLHAGINSIHFLRQFARIIGTYCRLDTPEPDEHRTWHWHYHGLIAGSEASPYLKSLYDTALAQYISRFGDKGLTEAGLWLYRAVYSLRLSNQKMVRESSVQKFANDTRLLDLIAHSFNHEQLIARLTKFQYEVSPENLEVKHGKKRIHIDSACETLSIPLTDEGAELTSKHIVDHFDSRLRQAIVLRIAHLTS